VTVAEAEVCAAEDVLEDKLNGALEVTLVEVLVDTTDGVVFVLVVDVVGCAEDVFVDGVEVLVVVSGLGMLVVLVLGGGGGGVLVGGGGVDAVLGVGSSPEPQDHEPYTSSLLPAKYARSPKVKSRAPYGHSTQRSAIWA